MNKILWTYWHQGFENAPFVIQRCIDRIKVLHPNWSIHLLDQHNIEKWHLNIHIRPEIWGKLSLQHRSDLIRTKLLIDHGGVWLDPTVFCLQALNDWLPPYLKSGLFLFRNPGRDRIISNWFIAAEPDNYFLKQLFKELVDYWNSYSFKNLGSSKTPWDQSLNRIINRNLHWPRLWFHPLMTSILQRYPYMVYHYKFFDLIQKDTKCMAIWQDIPDFHADIPHFLQRNGLLEPLSAQTKEWIDQNKSPLFKLKWKMDSDDISEGSNLHYLLKINN